MAEQNLQAYVNSPQEMQTFGAALGALLLAGDVLALNGDLGAGKTCLVQGIARGLDVTDAVTSPTFVLMRQYAGRIPLVHVDVYRLASLSDINDLGDDVLAGDCVTAIEWGEAVRPVLGDTFLDIEIVITPDDDVTERRVVTVTGHGDMWAKRHDALANVVAAYPTP